MMAALFSALQVVAIVNVNGADWAQWRGPEQTGATREKAIVTSWSLDGTNLLWKNDIGGRSTPIVVGNHVYYVTPVGEELKLKEAVICLDSDTGKTLWTTTFDMYLTDMAENRVGWTALTADPETGYVYIHTTSGEFACLDRDGKIVWKHSLLEEYSRVSGYGGRLHTPVIDEDRVIISFLNVNWGNQGRPTHRYIAFNKRDGSVVWWAEPGGKPEDTTYSVPVIAIIDGKRMMIAGNADGQVYGLLARTGEKVWTFDLSKRGLNVSPVVSGNKVYIAHSEENLDSTAMGRIVCIDGSKTGDITKSGEIWRRDGVTVGYASLAINNNRLYAVDNSAEMYCLDADTGKTHWEYSLGRVGKGSPVVTADGVIYVQEQTGKFHILKDAGDKCESLDEKQFEGPNHLVDEMFGSPAVVNGRVYFMSRYGTYCLGDKEAKPQMASVPPMAEETKSADAKATKLFVYPADVALYPGDSAHFEAQLFDANGRKVATDKSKVAWSVAGAAGEVGGDGTFKSDPKSPYSAGLLTAKVGEVSGVARVRIAPRLPIHENFDGFADNTMPPGWVGVAGKTRITERDGSKVFEKVGEKNKPSPAWRMRSFATLPQPIGYTVQADMVGVAARKRFKPDMGLLNCRYELQILGMAKEIELSRWRDEPNCGLRKRIPFEMKPDQWYTVKFTVDVKDGKAMLRGKVWPRGMEEPTEWTIEAEDPAPTSEGSPGLYAMSNGTTEKNDGASVFFDNFEVKRND